MKMCLCQLMLTGMTRMWQKPVLMTVRLSVLRQSSLNTELCEIPKATTGSSAGHLLSEVPQGQVTVLAAPFSGDRSSWGAAADFSAANSSPKPRRRCYQSWRRWM